MISFKTSPAIENMRNMLHMVAEGQMRPIARQYDHHDAGRPWDYVNFMWESVKARAGEGAAKSGDGKKDGRPREANMLMVNIIEELAWGDAGIYLATPNAGLAGFAIEAVGTPEQKERFLKRFTEGEPKWGAMAITEPSCGSDTAAIEATAVRDGDEWVLNGTKIFVTGGLMAAQDSPGVLVVWATLDKKAGRAGIKSFVVEAGTPGMKVIKVEDKLGIRASDTAAIVFEDCRIPIDNILGSAEVVTSAGTAGFKGAMATFDASRPAVAASGIGVARAALDALKELLEKEGVKIRYDAPEHELTAIERDVLDMEAQIQAARLLTYRSAWMMDQRQHNALEASMAKAKAGSVATKATQKAVEILGPLGYSQKLLFEKWMRDAKISDLYEGTQQINLLIIARRLLDYSSKALS
ncbi:MAG: acyl-CoA dehydrogenase family protein [Myxococcota bacterium]